MRLFPNFWRDRPISGKDGRSVANIGLKHRETSRGDMPEVVVLIAGLLSDNNPGISYDAVVIPAYFS